jgi:hypothetical protein
MQLFAICTCGFSQPIDPGDRGSHLCLFCSEAMRIACPHCATPLRSASPFCAKCGEGILDPVSPHGGRVNPGGSQPFRHALVRDSRQPGKG